MNKNKANRKIKVFKDWTHASHKPVKIYFGEKKKNKIDMKELMKLATAAGKVIRESEERERRNCGVE